jgi:transposase
MVLPPKTATTRRGELTERQWNQLKPLLPPQKPHTGSPSKDHRMVINGILWVLRTGAPWRDLPERYGCWSTVSGRFYHWRKIGLWQQILELLQQQADEQGKLNWQIHFVDGSVIRAHQHAAGAKRGN